MRAAAWCFGAGVLLGILPLGIVGDRPYSAVRILLAASAGFAVAALVAHWFDDGSDRRFRFAGGLSGAWLVLALALIVENG